MNHKWCFFGDFFSAGTGFDLKGFSPGGASMSAFMPEVSVA